MPRDMMTRCAVKRLYKVEGKKETRWIEIAVADLPAWDEADVRCAHCHGAVRIHRQKAVEGTQDHVVHRSRADAQHCEGGHDFQGTQRMSARPVE